MNGFCHSVDFPVLLQLWQVRITWGDVLKQVASPSPGFRFSLSVWGGANLHVYQSPSLEAFAGLEFHSLFCFGFWFPQGLCVQPRLASSSVSFRSVGYAGVRQHTQLLFLPFHVWLLCVYSSE